MVEEENFEFWDKIKYLFSDPTLFFEKIKSEEGIKNSLMMYFLIGIIFLAIGAIFAFGMLRTITSGNNNLGWMNYAYPLISLGTLGMGIALTFVYSGLIHLTINFIFKIPGNYKDTYNIFTYSIIPTLILSMIPLIGVLAIIYSFILMTIGLSNTYKISKTKAAIACLWPIGLILILILIVIGFFLINYRGLY